MTKQSERRPRLWVQVGVLGTRSDGSPPGCGAHGGQCRGRRAPVSLLRALQEDRCGQVKASGWPRDRASWARRHRPTQPSRTHGRGQHRVQSRDVHRAPVRGPTACPGGRDGGGNVTFKGRFISLGRAREATMSSRSRDTHCVREQRSVGPLRTLAWRPLRSLPAQPSPRTERPFPARWRCGGTWGSRRRRSPPQSEAPHVESARTRSSVLGSWLQN